MFGFWGKILRVDLTTSRYWEEEVDSKKQRLLLGGAALGADILLKESPPHIDPLSPENHLIFAVGLLQSLSFPGNSKWSVITKGALTGTFLDSAGSGHWAIPFKKCGYDALVIQGKAENPVYLYIHDDFVEFRDAGLLWGKDTIETGDYIKKELGNNQISALNIGPAGELMNPIACITCDGHSFAGRGGAGAVMGSKNLKAIAVWGSKEVPVRNREKASAKSKELFLKLHKQSSAFRVHGTGGGVASAEKVGDLPIRYWRGETWTRGAELTSGPRYTEVMNVTPWHCQNCPVGCHRRINYMDPNGEHLDGPGPEYETLGMMGGNLLVDHLPSICKANDIANRMGIDTISAGAFIGFLMECYEAGWLSSDQTDDRAFQWGDSQLLIDLTEEIALMRGVGSMFRKGIRGAAKLVGHEADKIIVEVKGLDYPAHDPRAMYAMGVNYATSTRGACHTRGFPQVSIDGFYFPELNEGAYDPYDLDTAAECAILYQDVCSMCNSITICSFMFLCGGLLLSDLVDYINLVTEWDMTVNELVECGARGFMLQKIINVRDGLRRKDDNLPPKIAIPSLTGNRAGRAPSDHQKILDDYYMKRNWSSNGVPTVPSLKKLGLDEYVHYLTNLK